jgi:hypothetical protein
MKYIIEDRDIDVDCINDIYSRTIIEEEPNGFKFGRSYAGPIHDAIEEANAECKENSELIIRITIETVNK